MSMKRIFMIMALLVALGISPGAYAQDDTATSDTNSTDTSLTAEQVGLSEEALEDEVVTEEDLDAQTPGRFHFFKTITRTIQRTVTRDPIKKAELRLEEANEELLRAKKIAAENPDNEKAAQKAQKAIDNFERNIEKVKEQADSIKEKKADQAGDFLEKIADFQIKQQKMLDNLEDKLPPQAYAQVQEAREKVLKHQVETMTKVAENQEQIAEKIGAAFEKQRGSDFKEFKQLEVLERVHEFVPEEARAAIEQAQEQVRQRFEERINQLPEDMRGARFEEYVQHINGDAVQQMRVLDGLKSNINVSDAFFERMEAAKEKTVGKFEEQFRRFETPEDRDAFLSAVADGNVEDLRVLQNIKSAIPEDIRADIEAKEKQAIRKFQQEFADDPDAQSRARKFEELSKKMRENPDPATFALIKKLEEELPPDQKAFVESLSQAAADGFEEQYRENRELFLKRIESFNPEAIEHLQQFQGGASSDIRGALNQAVNTQVNFVRQRIDEIDDPARFDRLKEQFNENPEIKRQIELRFGDLQSKLNAKEDELGQVRQQIETEFLNRVEEERAKRDETGKPDFSADELENLKQRFLLSPELRINQEVRTQIRDGAETRVKQEIRQQAQLQPNGAPAKTNQNAEQQGMPPADAMRDRLQQAPAPIQDRVENRLEDAREKIDDTRGRVEDARNELEDKREEFREENRGDVNSGPGPAGTREPEPIRPIGQVDPRQGSNFRPDGLNQQGEPFAQKQTLGNDGQSLPPPTDGPSGTVLTNTTGEPKPAQ